MSEIRAVKQQFLRHSIHVPYFTNPEIRGKKKNSIENNLFPYMHVLLPIEEFIRWKKKGWLSSDKKFYIDCGIGNLEKNRKHDLRTYQKLKNWRYLRNVWFFVPDYPYFKCKNFLSRTECIALTHKNNEIFLSEGFHQHQQVIPVIQFIPNDIESFRHNLKRVIKLCIKYDLFAHYSEVVIGLGGLKENNPTFLERITHACNTYSHLNINFHLFGLKMDQLKYCKEFMVDFSYDNTIWHSRKHQFKRLDWINNYYKKWGRELIRPYLKRIPSKSGKNAVIDLFARKNRTLEIIGVLDYAVKGIEQAEYEETIKTIKQWLKKEEKTGKTHKSLSVIRAALHFGFVTVNNVVSYDSTVKDPGPAINRITEGYAISEMRMCEKTPAYEKYRLKKGKNGRITGFMPRKRKAVRIKEEFISIACLIFIKDPKLRQKTILLYRHAQAFYDIAQVSQIGHKTIKILNFTMSNSQKMLKNKTKALEPLGLKEKLLIISCSQMKNKSPEKMSAINRYTGSVFKILRKFNPKHIDLLIISGKHGLLKPNDKIDYYDYRVSSKDLNKRSTIIEELVNYIDSNDIKEVLINLGKDYYELIRGFEYRLQKRRIRIKIFRTKGGIGKKNSQMRKWIVSSILDPFKLKTHKNLISFLTVSVDNDVREHV